MCEVVYSEPFIGGDGKEYPPLNDDENRAQVAVALEESVNIFRDIRFKKRQSYVFWEEALIALRKSQD